LLGLSSVIARPEGHLAELLLFSHARSPAAHLPLLAACAKQAYAPVREWKKKFMPFRFSKTFTTRFLPGLRCREQGAAVGQLTSASCLEPWETGTRVI
jgi:hypothetical protein